MIDKETLENLIEKTNKLPDPTQADKDAQLISFVFGNVALSNPTVTKDMVARAIKAEKGERR